MKVRMEDPQNFNECSIGMIEENLFIRTTWGDVLALEKGEKRFRKSDLHWAYIIKLPKFRPLLSGGRVIIEG